MNTEKMFKIILIFILVCGLIGCYCVKDKENFSTIEIDDNFNKSTLSGSYYYSVNEHGVEYLDDHNVDCNPDFNCKACVYHEESNDEANCISCNNDDTLDEMFDKGTEYATGICKNNVETSENVEESQEEGQEEGQEESSDEDSNKVDDKETCKSDDDCTKGKFCKYFEDTQERHCKIRCGTYYPACPDGEICVTKNWRDPNEKSYCGPGLF